ncbi:MAG: hypothetical protein JW734_09495 [Candidatus Omnitrophica bacterium]|nr:hypothetical protein [Candidatus Omnitrophota bacterium]
MKSRITVALAMVCGLAIFAASIGFAADIIISAEVPQATDVNVVLSRVTGDSWTPAASMNFGTLALDEDLGIFLPPYYFAADVGVNGGAPWTIQHSVSGADFTTGGLEALGDNVIVTFMKQTGDEEGSELGKVLIMNASRSYSNVDLYPGWLRVYYGISTGEPGAEPAGATPITVHEYAGNYSGTVTISLTAN